MFKHVEALVAGNYDTSDLHIIGLEGNKNPPRWFVQCRTHHKAPVTTLEDGVYVDPREHFGGEDTSSYLFDGQLGYMYYVLVGKDLMPFVTGAASWHANSDKPTDPEDPDAPVLAVGPERIALQDFVANNSGDHGVL